MAALTVVHRVALREETLTPEIEGVAPNSSKSHGEGLASERVSASATGAGEVFADLVSHSNMRCHVWN
ncbi:hypothetical protein [Antarcticirhabdus aurantiaca]|uniref:Uncharacterized protein n=1 Tax=Antarcticirhabdus aurantiaca TaxID=2606717 RepID=A0ACD4NXL9_9HYPH|nr:hypothetical protein OXU80_15390 [Jeongeuplla avenae]